MGKLNLSLQSAGDSVAAQFDLPWLSGDFSQARAAPLTESDAGFDTALLRNLISHLLTLMACRLWVSSSLTRHRQILNEELGSGFAVFPCPSKRFD